MTALTDSERSFALEELEVSRRRLLAALEGLTDEQWRSRPTPTSWSIAECAEHITAAEIALPKLFEKALSEDLPPGEDKVRIRDKDDFVRTFLRDRSRRDEAPERLQPKGRFPTREQTVQTFEERRGANIAYVRETSHPLRERFAPHPFAGVIDGYQWILFLAAHTDRHAAQIQEIRGALKVEG